MQIATRDEALIVDPLANGADLAPVEELIADPSIETIVHSGEQDLDIFFRRTGRVPRRIFDTQIAAALLGLGEQIGYAPLLERLLGVRVDKLETLTDWSKRPLTKEQTAYALDDVRHLHALRDALASRLGDKGRLSWLEEEVAFYEQVGTYRLDYREGWRRIPRARSLEPRVLAILRELVAWREELAQLRDVPRGRIVHDDILVEISRRAPRRPTDLSVFRGLHPSLIERDGQAIVAAVARGAALRESEWPSPAAGRSEDPEGAIVLDLLEVLLRARALEIEIAPSYLGTRRDLLDLLEFVRGRDPAKGKPRLLDGWRGVRVGADLVCLAEGRSSIAIDRGGGGVRVTERT